MAGPGLKTGPVTDDNDGAATPPDANPENRGKRHGAAGGPIMAESGVWLQLQAVVCRVTKDKLRLFALFLKQRGMAVHVEKEVDGITAYVPLAGATQRRIVADAQTEVVRRFGDLGFEIVVLYPDDLGRASVQRLLRRAPAI